MQDSIRKKLLNFKLSATGFVYISIESLIKASNLLKMLRYLVLSRVGQVINKDLVLQTISDKFFAKRKKIMAAK